MADLPVAEGRRSGGKAGGINWVVVGGVAGASADNPYMPTQAPPPPPPAAGKNPFRK